MAQTVTIDDPVMAMAARLGTEDDKREAPATAWPRRNVIKRDAQGRCWHVVHSQVQHAPGACEAIKKQGYPFYYPMMREMKTPALRNIHSAKRAQLKGIARPVLSPVFPGYPFVQFNMETGNWHELFDLFGILGMIVADGLPAPIGDDIIERIMRLEIGGAIPLETPVAKILFDVGEVVRIEDGPFQGFNGTIQELDESHRRVLLEILMFNRPTKAPFDVGQIAKL